MAEQRFAVVLDGVVDNVVIWDPADQPAWVPLEGVAAPCADHVGVGWRWLEGRFQPPESHGA